MDISSTAYFWISTTAKKFRVAIPSSLWNEIAAFRDGLDAPLTGSSELEVVIEFLSALIGLPGRFSCLASQLALVSAFLAHVHELLGGQHIISVVQSYETGSRRKILKTYYSARDFLSSNGVAVNPQPVGSLLSAAAEGKAKIFLTFGGQGRPYIEELRDLYDTYPETRRFISSVLKSALSNLTAASSRDESVAQLLAAEPAPFNPLLWLSNPQATPDHSTVLSRALYSYPLIGLSQLAQYHCFVTTSGLGDFGKVLELVKGTTGHSQGICSSVVVATSTTQSEYLENSSKMISYLIFQGLRDQQVFSQHPGSRVTPDVLAQAKEISDSNVPTPMLAVSKVPTESVLAMVAAVNKKAPKEFHVSIGLFNDVRTSVVAGPPQCLVALQKEIVKKSAKPGEDQTRVPFSKRKPDIITNFLSVSVPFHSTLYIGQAAALVAADSTEYGLLEGLSPSKLRIPVYSTFDGSDLRTQSTDLKNDLIHMQCCQPVHWPKALSPAICVESGATHVIDFGPGNSGSLVRRVLDGQGVQVVQYNVYGTGAAPSSPTEPFDKNAIYSTTLAVTFASHWEREFSPKLVKLAHDGTLFVDTKYSRLLGRAPILVGGMTPCTATPGIVAACENAGFHAELAGGGQAREHIFRKTVDDLCSMLNPGLSLSVNMLFLNAKQWGFQYPLCLQMRREGYPIESITIAAGTPSIEKSTEILDGLLEVGIKYVSFKPGSVEAIKQCVQIAAANPKMQVMLQWTGGRAGGHHSAEDEHEPILETYSLIRSQPNIILVAGGGFGDAEQTAPYITGDWSLAYGFPRMPFDGILVASRIMTAKECLTAAPVKQLLVDTPGVENERDWEKSFDTEAGGIVTVLSELDEPIHVVSNRCTLFWRQMDKEIFSLKSAAEQEQAAIKKRAWIIERLNSDYQKVWFGKNEKGQVVDLSEMTYKEVAMRMAEIMYVPAVQGREDPHMPRDAPGRWIDPTFRRRVLDFLVRTQERFHPSSSAASSLLSSPTGLDVSPVAFVSEVFAKMGDRANTALLCTEDLDFFLHMCKNGGKPVNFVPTIDKDIKFYFKKDSLWYSEDIYAVPGHDAQRVFVLQGPIAVRFHKKVDEPAGEILGSINQGLISSLLARNYSNNPTLVPTTEYLGGPSSASPLKELPATVSVSTTGSARTYTVTTAAALAAETGDAKDSDNEEKSPKVKLPTREQWVEALAGPQPSWICALLASPVICRGKRQLPNPFLEVFEPREGQVVEVSPNSITVRHSSSPSVRAEYNPENRLISVAISVEGVSSVASTTSPVSLVLNYQYRPDQGFCPIHEDGEQRERAIRDMYKAVWVPGMKEEETEQDLSTRVLTGVVRATRESIASFLAATSNKKLSKSSALTAPLDYAIVGCWEPLIQSVLVKEISGDLLRLVHLSNEFTVASESETYSYSSEAYLPRKVVALHEGQYVHSRIRITQVAPSKDTDGTVVTVTGRLSVADVEVLSSPDQAQPWVDITSSFLIRGKPASATSSPFFSTSSEVRTLRIADQKALSILLSKPWFKLEGSSAIAVGDELVIDYQVREVFAKSGGDVLARTEATGKVWRKADLVATIELLEQNVRSNIVREYLTRSSVLHRSPRFFENGGYRMLSTPDVARAPLEHLTYGLASKDLNPIHINPYVAAYCGLGEVITHGMWTSANGRRVVEQLVCNGNSKRINRWSAKFVGMVHAGDSLYTQITHTGMKSGAMILEVETANQNGTVVLKATAEVEQPSTAYVFTGQGSAEPGMGMDLYASSAEARAVWDRAEQHLKDTFGFSILEIVRKNPKELTVHFGGVRGKKIKENYMQLKQEVTVRDPATGQEKRVERPLIPEITERSTSHTFRAAEGLLFATQFTQPALTLTEKAALEDMRARGLIANDFIFAGHSLGEYAALSSVANIIGIEPLVEIVFVRGLTMQTVVTRDEKGRSNFAMVAVNCSRVGPFFNEAKLHMVVEAIQKRNNIMDASRLGVSAPISAAPGTSASNLGRFGSMSELTHFNSAADFVRLNSVADFSKISGESGETPATPQGLGSRVLSTGSGSNLDLQGMGSSGQLVPTSSFTEEDEVAAGNIIQVVNYNVQLLQYVVAGDLLKLETLSRVLTAIKENPKLITLNTAAPGAAGTTSTSDVAELVDKCFRQAVEKKNKSPEGFLVLERGTATIPLRGIDVPFHSRFLLSGVPAFRNRLHTKISSSSVDPSVLETKYIPNVTARPFALTVAYLDLVYKQTKAPQLGDLLKKLRSEGAKETDAIATSSEQRRELSYTLLVELLAYQFASPVRWIETQDIMFKQRVERFIEIGPAPTLANMARQTLATQGQNYGYTTSPQVCWNIKDKSSIYYELEDQGPSLADFVASQQAANAPAAEESAPAQVSAPVAAAPVFVAAPVAAAPAPAAAAPRQADSPISATEAIQTIVATKTKKPFAEVKPDTNIKALVGGKSALQNEILGDLQKEFSGASNFPENAAELPISQLGQAVGANYSALGKYLQPQVSKLMSSKMPAGFGMAQVSAYLSQDYGLGDGRTNSILAHSLTSEPAARLKSDGEAKQWLDSVVSSYSQATGVSISKGAAAPAAASFAPQAMMMMGGGGAPSAAPVPDAPVSPLDFLRVLVATKLKKSVKEVPESKSIKDLVAGKSALQNEIIGDVQKELSGTPAASALPENAAEQPLSAVAAILSASYTALGKHSQAAVNKLVSSKMPAGFGMSQIKGYLSSERLLGAGRSDSVLLYALALEPAQRLGSEGEAKAFLDSACDEYASASGVSIPRASQGGASAGGMPMMAMMSAGPAVSSALQSKIELLARQQMASYAEFLDTDLRDGDRRHETALEQMRRTEAELNLWVSEHGKEYGEGLRSQFDARKERKFDSWWNWARQDLVQLFFRLINNPPTAADPQLLVVREHLLNRSSQDLIDLCSYLADKAQAEGQTIVASAARSLLSDLRSRLFSTPIYRPNTAASPITAPQAAVDDKEGKVVYKEVPRDGVQSYVEYVDEMEAGVLGGEKKAKKPKKSPEEASLPFIFIEKPDPANPSHRTFDKKASRTFFGLLRDIATNGVSFAKKTALVTGCGKGSIGLEIVKGLLEGGARVIVTTSRFSKDTADSFRATYQRHGAKGSELILLPFNASSLADINSIVDWVYESGIKSDLDYLIPFAALPEAGNDVGSIDSKSELAHRAMLTNVIRLIGAVKEVKTRHGYNTRPTHCILPLSPNHGLFGFDGLYSESKLGLEALMNKCAAEGWSEYVTLCGAVIGWTRGTGLMSANNVTAQAFEDLGARTFSQSEMSFNLLASMHPELIDFMHEHERPAIWLDLTGGFARIEKLNEVTSRIRKSLSDQAAVTKAVITDSDADQKAKDVKAQKSSGFKMTPRARVEPKFPQLPSDEKLASLSHLRGMVDLENTIVVVGFGETGPFGNARTRWEFECNGKFSHEGCIELAWIMGLIKYHHGPLKTDGSHYTGWVDAASGAPVSDWDVKGRYEETILKHTGIRFVEPALFEGYDPHKKLQLHQVAITRDMNEIEVGSKEEADHFKAEHGEGVEVYQKHGSEQWFVKFRKGAVLYLPKAIPFDRFVAGQIPTGWDAGRYGIPQDIINQVDPVTLYTLVAAMEAFVGAGITDPYELYQHVHVSEVGNTAGGGIGGMRSIRRTYRERLLEKPVQGDILQEIFINVIAAWVNLLLLSASGPVKTPVGACATAAESVDIGVDTIRAGKAKVVLVGGYDDFGEEGSYEFGQMKATSNSVDEISKGREPSEMSRPATTTRGGFMESQGAGIQIITTAELAIRMGLPIYSIVALSNTASDKEGRSVPAPGQGILTSAREKRTEYENLDASLFSSPLLDTHYRKEQLDAERTRIAEWALRTSRMFETQAAQIERTHGPEAAQAFLEERRKHVQKETRRLEKNALSVWGNDFYVNDPSIAPLRGALSVFGLTIDDLAVASFHGTGTKANDMNESEVTHLQLQHLGRTKGNILYTIFQKYLTGHPKGAAAAWMMNGLIQSMLEGVVPGNRNLDNADSELRKFSDLLYSDKSIKVGDLKAGMLKSFGFGQAGGEIVLVHPDHLLATLDPAVYADYASRRTSRERASFRYWSDVYASKRTFVKVKDTPPYTHDDEQKVYLNPDARAAFQPAAQSWGFSAEKAQPPAAPVTATPRASSSSSVIHQQQSSATRLQVTMREAAEGIRQPGDRGLGIDVESVDNVHSDNDDFVSRNFTPAEVEYCRAGGDSQIVKQRFAGRWCAKEAVIKAISDSNPSTRSLWTGAAAPVRDIEVVPSDSGAPRVVLHGKAREIATLLGIAEVKVSISYTAGMCVAQAIAK